MATLLSPGVDVPIYDESFYGSAGAGTIPLIIMATAANKTSPSGSGYAPMTAPSKAGELFLATSQRELIQEYGNPNFYSVQGTQVHGHELNEFGLHAAYTYLGISNRAYVLRADIDLKQLEASVSAPKGEPIAGQYWLDLDETVWGVFQSNGSPVTGLAWEPQPVLVASHADVVQVNPGLDVPLPTFGQDGDFAVVVTVSNNLFFEKINGTWFQIETNAWRSARPTKVTGKVNPAVVANGAQFKINDTVVTVGANGADGQPTSGDIAGIAQIIRERAIENITADVVASSLVIINTAGGNVSLANVTGAPLDILGFTGGKTTSGVRVVRTSDAQYPAGSSKGDVWVKGTTPNRGASWSVKLFSASVGSWVKLTAPLIAFDALKPETDPNKDANAVAQLGVPVAGTVYVAYDTVIDPVSKQPARDSLGVQQIRRFNGQKWEPLEYVAAFDAPAEPPQDGTYWFNKDYRVDIMVGDGNTWCGYRRYYPATDPNGVILSGSAPLTQSNGAPLVDYDLWIDTSDEENYPALYRYDTLSRRFKKVDTTDQTTPFGITFADARSNSGVAFTAMPNPGSYAFESERTADMLLSDYLEPDAPDPRAYPAGMMLFNTRYSNNNVKVWRPFHFEEGNYDENTNFSHDEYHVGDPFYVFPPLATTGTWVTASGLRLDGTPNAGRKAQRAMIVKAMQAAVNSNEDLRSEMAYYNLMAAPGYPELIDELISLNIQQKEVSFIVGDTPIRLKPQGTAIQNWAKNPKGYSNGEDGLSQASLYAYAGVYYPWGLGNNIDGSEVMIPPATMALATIAYNDSVAYPWYAPAGYQRGLVSTATTVGYLTDEGEFKPVLLNQGQRDTLYTNRINPIAFMPGRGLVVYGQKTLYAQDSALDRINVARLTNYLKYNLDNLMRPFLFQQNDQQTRDSAKLTVERFLAGLVTLRALEDFAVLCDETNNTPERRDRNELWVDILIKPIKAIEFIYVPVRIRNSSDSLLFR